MFKGLTKTIGLLLFLLFISGSLLIPFFHKSHCDEQTASGCDTRCAICQIIHTPCITSHSPITIITEYFFVAAVQIKQSLFVAAMLCNLCQARAPPVV